MNCNKPLRAVKGVNSKKHEECVMLPYLGIYCPSNYADFVNKDCKEDLASGLGDEWGEDSTY